MGAHGIVRDINHRERLTIKHMTLNGLNALYDEWRAFGKEPDDPYMLHLSKRIKITEAQIRNMRP